MFEGVGLQTNLYETKAMICTSGFIWGQQGAETHKWRATGEGPTFIERKRTRISCEVCGETMAASYLRHHMDRGYIPKVFSFKNPYPLNPEKSDLFYFLLIRTKQPKSSKLQRAVSSSSAVHAIKGIPSDTKTLAFLLILLQNANSRGMRKSLLKVPTVVGF